MKTMKSRIATAIVTSVLAIAPFTGTGISTVDKVITKNTAITASAYAYEFRGQGWYVSMNYQWVGPRHFNKGQKMWIAADGTLDGVDVTNWVHQGWVQYYGQNYC